jgi:hypothetical protein
VASATKRTATEVLVRAVARIGAHLAEARIEAAQSGREGAVPRVEAAHENVAASTAIAADHEVALRRGPAGVVLLTGNATGRERSERTIPPGRWMGGSDCRGDV